MGLRSESDGYSLPFGELCVALQLSTDYLRKNWSELEGGDVMLFVDHVFVFSSTIRSGALTSRHDKNGNLLEATKGEDRESYCFAPGLQTGSHQLTIQIQTIASKNYRYDWSFNMEPAQSTAYHQGA